MALKEPKELLQVFDKALTTLRSTDLLSKADLRQIVDDLADVYNYVSETSRKPSFTNALYATSSQNAKMRMQLEQEREELHEHQQFVENNFDKAEQYLRAIQLGGYATFFALWSVTKDQIPPVWAALAALLMLISATTFVIWEVVKSTILAFSLKRHASIGSGKIEEFMKSRMEKLTKEKSSVFVLAQSRTMVWLMSIIPAIAAIGILLFQLLNVVQKGFFR